MLERAEGVCGILRIYVTIFQWVAKRHHCPFRGKLKNKLVPFMGKPKNKLVT